MKAIIVQRRIWQERRYDLQFANLAFLSQSTILFWEDFSPVEKQQLLAQIQAGIVIALEAIPL